MPAIQSSMIPLGATAPDFNLTDTRTGQMASLQELKSDKATVIMFICNHCPFVKHIQRQLTETVKNYQSKGIHFVAISSNDVTTFPQDGPEAMRLEAEKNHYSFPYLYDKSQEVAKEYHATCTPDFFVFDKNLHCIYRGRFDESTPGNNISPTGADLIQTLDNILNGKPVNADQKPSIGCSIKWKK